MHELFPSTRFIVLDSSASSPRENSNNDNRNNMKKFQLDWDNMLSEFDKHGKQLKTAQGSFDDIIGPRKRALEKIVDKITSSDSSDDKE